MRRSALVVFVCLSVAGTRILASEASTPPYSIDAEASPHWESRREPHWDLSPLMSVWPRAGSVEIPDRTIHSPSVPLIYQQRPYPSVPLPPTILGTASLGVAWAGLRGLRYLRKIRRARHASGGYLPARYR